MKSIISNSSGNIVKESGSYKGVLLTVLCVGTANTAFTGAMIAPEKSVLKVVRTRNRKETVICEKNIRDLIYTASIEKPVAEYLLDNTKHILTKAHGVGIKPTATIPLFFDFGTVLNIKPGDKLTAELQIIDGFYTSQMDSTSQINFDLIEGIGIETYTPVFKSRTIDAAAESPSENLGSNIHRIVLLNLDKDTLLTADQVWNSLTLSSDKVNFTDQHAELKARNQAHYPTSAAAELRFQKFLLHDDEVELDNVTISGSTTSANVTNSKNLILWRTYVSDAELVGRAIATSEKHEARGLQKLGVTPRFK